MSALPVNSPLMDLQGDPLGVAALKELHASDKEFVKFLLNEARSNFDLTARFTAKDGKKWVVKYDARSGIVDVQPAT